MKHSRQAGFTIIEVMLYLAIVGMLFLISFWGTKGQLDDFQFSDSMRNLTSFLQQQYSDVQNGVNPRPTNVTCTADQGNPNAPPTFGTYIPGPNDTAGEANECVLMGKLVQFSPGTNTVTVYYIVGRYLDPSLFTGNDVTDIQNSVPTLSPVIAQTYNIEGATTFYQPNQPTTSLTESFAFIRSPSSGNLLTFVFNNQQVNNTTGPGADSTFRAALTTADLASNPGYCFNDDTIVSRYSIIQLDQGAINVSFPSTINVNTQCVNA
jgi:type II secretory pathway pseudopilin PulG